MIERRKNILIFTGNGKGKSTAAFGMALRAVGHGQSVLIIQFLKQDDGVGELEGFRLLGVTVKQLGQGFVPQPDNPAYESHCSAARQGLAFACDALNSGQYDMVILDEICGAVAKGLLKESDVVRAIETAPPQNIVLTGRGATERLISLADTVSEIQPLKHALAEGVPARKGIEF